MGENVISSPGSDIVSVHTPLFTVNLIAKQAMLLLFHINKALIQVEAKYTNKMNTVYMFLPAKGFVLQSI